MIVLKVLLVTLLFVPPALAQEEGAPVQCKENETYRECGTCEQNCNDPENFGCSSERRPAQCQCNHGFARAKNGTCIPRKQCSYDLELAPIPDIRARRDVAEGNKHQFKSPNAGRRKRQPSPEHIFFDSPLPLNSGREEREAPLISVSSTRDNGGPQKHTRVSFLGAQLAAIDRDDDDLQHSATSSSSSSAGAHSNRPRRETQTDDAALAPGAAGKGDAAVERKSRERRDEAPAVRINVKSTVDKPTKVRIIGKSKTTIETEQEGGTTKAKLEIRPARDTSKWSEMVPGNVDLGPEPKQMLERTQRSTPLVSFVIPEDKSGTTPVPKPKRSPPPTNIDRHIEAEGKVQSERIEDALQETTTAEASTEEAPSAVDSGKLVGENVTVAPVGAEYVSMAPLVLVNRTEETHPPPSESPEKKLAEAEGEVQAERVAEALQTTAETTTTEPTTQAATTAEATTETSVTKKVVKVTAVPLVTVKPKKVDESDGTKATLIPIGTKEVTIAALKTTKADEQDPRKRRDADKKTTVVPLAPVKVVKVADSVGNVTKSEEREASEEEYEERPRTTTPSMDVTKRIEAEGEVQAERIAAALRTTTAKPSIEASTQSEGSSTPKSDEPTKATLIPLGTKKVTVALLKKGKEHQERRRREVRADTLTEVEKSIDSEGERIAESIGDTTTSAFGHRSQIDVTDEGRGITLIPLGRHTPVIEEPEPGATVIPEAGQQKRKRRNVALIPLPHPEIERRIESEGAVQSERIAEALQPTTEAGPTATSGQEGETVTAEPVTLATILTTGKDRVAYNTWETLAIARIQGKSTAQPDTMRNSLRRVEAVLPSAAEPLHHSAQIGDESEEVADRTARHPQIVPDPLEGNIGPDVRGRREVLKDGTPTLDKPADQILGRILSDPENVPPKPIVVEQPRHDLDLAKEPMDIDKLPSEKTVDTQEGEMTPIPGNEAPSLDRAERQVNLDGFAQSITRGGSKSFPGGHFAASKRDAADMGLMIQEGPRLDRGPSRRDSPLGTDPNDQGGMVGFSKHSAE